MTKFAAYGAVLEHGDGLGNWTTVAQVESLSGGGIRADFEDMTTHDSPGALEEIVMTILRQPEISVGLAWDPTDPTHDGSTGLLAEAKNRTLSPYRIVLPDDAATTWEITAYCLGFEPAEITPTGGLRSTATLKPSGQSTLP